MRSRLFTCERTVCSEMKRRCAISSVPWCSSSRSSTSSSRAESGEQILLGAGGGEDDDLTLGRGLAEAGQRGEAVEAGHEEIEQDEVGLRLRCGGDRLLSVGRDPGKLEAV